MKDHPRHTRPLRGVLLPCVILVIIAGICPRPSGCILIPIENQDGTAHAGAYCAADTVLDVWHHDCSNLTAFSGVGDNSWPHDSVVSVTFGSVKCSGIYFYSDDVGVGTGHHGPLYYCTLENPFVLRDFRELQAEIGIEGFSNERRGWIRVGLHAPDNATILTLQVADPSMGISEAYANAIYKFENGTKTETPTSYFSPEPYRETLTLFSNSSGLYTLFPDVENFRLLESDQLETSREVKYISIQFNGYGADVPCETMRIFDIRLTTQYAIEFPVIDSPTDIAYESGTTGHTILWTPSALNPDSYAVFRDGSIQETSSWDGSAIDVSVDELALGVHNVTLAVTARCGNSSSDTVFVQVVDTTRPEKITGASDVAYTFGETGHTLVWSFFELNPAEYQILVDGEVELTLPWGGASVSFIVDGFAVGEHIVTVEVFDESGNAASDSAYVRVAEAPPSTNINIDLTLISAGGLIGGALAVYTYCRRKSGD